MARPSLGGALHVGVVRQQDRHVTGKLASQLDDIGRAARKHLDSSSNLEERAPDLPAQRHRTCRSLRARSDARVIWGP